MLLINNIRNGDYKMKKKLIYTLLIILIIVILVIIFINSKKNDNNKSVLIDTFIKINNTVYKINDILLQKQTF